MSAAFRIDHFTRITFGNVQLSGNVCKHNDSVITISLVFDTDRSWVFLVFCLHVLF